MFVFINNQSGTHNVIVTPSSTTPDTFEDGSTSVIVPPGTVGMFQSDGVTKWRVLSSRRQATAPALLSGAGTLDITRETTLFTSTGGAQAIVLPNGTYKGQRHTITHTVDGGSGVITPATAGGNFTTLTLTSLWDWGTVQWDGAHWNLEAAGAAFAGLA